MLKRVALQARCLTEVVDHIGLAPLRSMRTWALCALGQASIQEQDVKIILSKFLEDFTSKRLDQLQVGELQRQ